jgi:FkbM family methyltransferase
MSKIRRLNKLKGTKSSVLSVHQITCLELLELVKDDVKSVYDVGANQGDWTLLASTILPHASINAFEPLQQYQAIFESKHTGNPKITLHKVGVGSENKEAVMNVASHSSSFLEIGENITKVFPSQVKTGEETVQMIRLDDYVSKNSLPQPDLIKLDVEGFELEVLKGALDLLKNTKYLILEVSFIERHIGQPLFHDLVTYLAEHNFVLYSIAHGIATGTPLYAHDVMFINKNILK